MAESSRDPIRVLLLFETGSAKPAILREFGDLASRRSVDGRQVVCLQLFDETKKKGAHLFTEFVKGVRKGGVEGVSKGGVDADPKRGYDYAIAFWTAQADSCRRADEAGNEPFEVGVWLGARSDHELLNVCVVDKRRKLENGPSATLGELEHHKVSDPEEVWELFKTLVESNTGVSEAAAGSTKSGHAESR